MALDSSSTGKMKSGSLLDETDTNYWRENYLTRPYANKTADFDADVAPAYGYGTAASRRTAESGVTGSGFSEQEVDLRSGWDQARGSSTLTYDQARPAIEDAFNRTLRLHEERLKIGKDRVETGQVNLRKEIVTEQKQIEVPVEREEVVITTTTLTGEAADGATIGDGETIRVPVSEERVNVQKEVIPTGEVRLDKKMIQDTKTVVDNLRKETVKVEKTGNVRVTEEAGNRQ